MCMVFISALSITLTTQVILLLWVPRVDQGYVLYILAVAMGIANTTLVVMLQSRFSPYTLNMILRSAIVHVFTFRPNSLGMASAC